MTLEEPLEVVLGCRAPAGGGREPSELLLAPSQTLEWELTTEPQTSRCHPWWRRLVWFLALDTDRDVRGRTFSAQHADDDQDQQDDEQRSETDIHVVTSQLIGKIVPVSDGIETLFR
jgi:hypothetical protein